MRRPHRTVRCGLSCAVRPFVCGAFGVAGAFGEAGQSRRAVWPCGSAAATGGPDCRAARRVWRARRARRYGGSGGSGGHGGHGGSGGPGRFPGRSDAFAAAIRRYQRPLRVRMIASRRSSCPSRPVRYSTAMHGTGMSGCTTPSTARVHSSMRTIETAP